MIHVAVRDQDAGDGRIARAAGVQAREALDLGADLRRGIQQKPVVAVGADGNRFLGARACLELAAAHAAAIGAAAVPLWKSAARRRSQYSYFHLCRNDSKSSSHP